MTAYSDLHAPSLDIKPVAMNNLQDFIAFARALCEWYKDYNGHQNRIACGKCGRKQFVTMGARSGLFFTGFLFKTPCDHCGPSRRFAKYDEAVQFLVDGAQASERRMPVLMDSEARQSESIGASGLSEPGRENDSHIDQTFPEIPPDENPFNA